MSSNDKLNVMIIDAGDGLTQSHVIIMWKQHSMSSHTRHTIQQNCKVRLSAAQVQLLLKNE